MSAAHVGEQAAVASYLDDPFSSRTTKRCDWSREMSRVRCRASRIIWSNGCGPASGSVNAHAVVPTSGAVAYTQLTLPTLCSV